MGKVFFDISMSLDGFITAANRRPEQPMGDGGERLHQWAFGSSDERDRALLTQGISETGAVITGRRNYEDSLPWWGADGPTGPVRLPVFVVSHNPPTDAPADGVYHFVNGGVFALQWIMGLIINQFAADAAGHYPPQAHSAALFCTATGTLLALWWYLPLVKQKA
jgi:hypothetical protein